MFVFFIFLLCTSLIVNVVLTWYASKLIKTCYRASEAVSEILVRFDAYKVHLKGIFELEMFYGDRNLKEVIEHTRDMMNFLKKFDGLYSFTQPELEDVLSKDDDFKENDINEESKTNS